MTITKMILLDLYIFIHCIKWPCEKLLTEPRLSSPHWERVNKEIEATGPDVCSLWRLQIRSERRYGKYTVKQFEISIIITSCLLSLVSRVTFHTGESRGSLWREGIGSSSWAHSDMTLCYCLQSRAELSIQVVCIYPAERRKQQL